MYNKLDMFTLKGNISSRRDYMLSFSTVKDKRYLILLILAILILVLFAIFAPDNFLGKPYILLIFMTLFWSTYHMWRYFGDKKKNNTDDSCDL